VMNRDAHGAPRAGRGAEHADVNSLREAPERTLRMGGARLERATSCL
jgi:hypothetical protein